MTMVNANEGARELIAFCVGEQEFSVDIQSVREIRGFAPATPIPHAPDFVTGVINLRGTVLPIIDLSLRFGFGRTKPTPRSVIIVVAVGTQLVGVLVDAVSDILTVTDQNLQPSPDVVSDMARTFVRGVIALEGRMISLIGTDHLLPPTQALAA